MASKVGILTERSNDRAVNSTEILAERINNANAPETNDRPPYNATGYITEHDEFDHGILAAFSDIQTVFLACISTLLPLIIAFGVAFGIRHLWRKYTGPAEPGRWPWYMRFHARHVATRSRRYNPNPPTRGNPVSGPLAILSARELVNGFDRQRYEPEVMAEINSPPMRLPIDYTAPSSNLTSRNANGNIITLTLKNNHLIVETEERTDAAENSRDHQERRDNECSFVVEVQYDYKTDSQNEAAGNKSCEDVAEDAADQRALVHREEAPDSSGFQNAKLFGSTNTGLSQSDLSISSQDSVNPSYRYGNQMEYDAGHLGYPMYGGSYECDTLERSLEGGSKWVDFDKSPSTERALKSDSKTSSLTRNPSESSSISSKRNTATSTSNGRQDSTDASNSTDTVRSNPDLQVNGTTPSKLERTERKAMNNELAGSNEAVVIAEEEEERQRKFGNGTVTLEHVEKHSRTNREKPEGSTFVPSHKRAGSIPPRLIEESFEIDRKKPFDIYNQIKTSTKNMLPGLSPKFELLQNEVSPIEEKES